MKSVLRLVLIAVLMGVGAWMWTVLFPSPEKIIRRRLVELARIVSTSPGENDLARLADANNVASFFAASVELKVTLPILSQHSSLEREEISGMVYAGRSQVGRLRVTFPDINVKVAPDKQSAVADLTVEATYPGDRQLQEMKIFLRRVDGQWLITRAETVQVLS